MAVLPSRYLCIPVASRRYLALDLALAAASRHGTLGFGACHFVVTSSLACSASRLPAPVCRLVISASLSCPRGLTATAASSWHVPCIVARHSAFTVMSRQHLGLWSHRIVLHCRVWSVLPWSRRCGAVGVSSAPCLLAPSVTSTCRALAFHAPGVTHTYKSKARRRKRLKKLLRRAARPSCRVVVLGLLVAWACCLGLVVALLLLCCRLAVALGLWPSPWVLPSLVRFALGGGKKRKNLSRYWSQ